jgi:two-component system nitrogen regulation response regulator NtrX
VVPIRSPALRERVEDIPLLARAFMADFCAEYAGRQKRVDPGVFDRLAERPWPGNVRELRNVIERMVILSGPEITADDVPVSGLVRENGNAAAAKQAVPLAPASTGKSLAIPLPEGTEMPSLRDFRDSAEREYICMTLKSCDWNISRAAALLGVERTNLHKKMRALGIHRAD